MMRFIFWTLLLFSMWMILTTNLEVANILIGLGISSSISLLYIKMFVHKEIEMINPYYLFIYLLILAKNLVLSNIHIAKRTLSKDMKLNPKVVAVKTSLKSDWKKLLLANSITLTPGTLTLDIEKDTLYIHVIECKESESKELIIQEFENIIKKI